MSHNRALHVVRRLMEEDAGPPAPIPSRRVNLAHLKDEHWQALLDGSQQIWLDLGGGDVDQFLVNLDFLAIFREGDRHGTAVVFEDEIDLSEFIERYGGDGDSEHAARSAADVQKHVYRSPAERYAHVPTYSLEQRQPYVVFRHGPFIFLKLPTDPDYIQREGISMQHPVHGDTRVVTYDGIVPIRTIAGTRPTLLTRTHGRGYQRTRWVTGEIRSFGVQPLWKVVLTRNRRTREVFTTATHRWYAFNNTRNKQYLRLAEKTTETLEVGNRVPYVYGQRIPFKSENPKGITLSAYGIAHGVVFGDGHAPLKNKANTGRPAQITLYGKKDAELLKWFPETVRQQLSTRSIGGVTVNELPRYFKQLPPTDESVSYLVGWLAGYLAADGNVTTDGCAGLHSAVRPNLEFAEMLCQRFGIRTTGISNKLRKGFGKTTHLYRLGFEVGALPDDFFLLAGHRSRNKPKVKASENWTILRTEPTGTEAEVFCAIVPETGCFVLDGNILTGNCLSVAHKDYCARMLGGEIDVYSLVDTRDNEPKVDIEVALKKSSYSRDAIPQPTVTQIRGHRNQVPPKDDYLPALAAFFKNYGKDWRLGGHGVRNFDGNVDGDLFLKRWRELQGE